MSDSVLEVIHFPSGESDFPLTVRKLFNFAVSLVFFVFFKEVKFTFM